VLQFDPCAFFWCDPPLGDPFLLIFPFFLSQFFRTGLGCGSVFDRFSFDLYMFSLMLFNRDRENSAKVGVFSSSFNQRVCRCLSLLNTASSPLAAAPDRRSPPPLKPVFAAILPFITVSYKVPSSHLPPPPPLPPPFLRNLFFFFFFPPRSRRALSSFCFRHPNGPAWCR